MIKSEQKNIKKPILKLSIWKRIIANIIDYIGMVFTGIPFLINLYLYYRKWTTIWLIIFGAHIVDEKTLKIPRKNQMTKRALTKYIWLILWFVLANIAVNILMDLMMYYIGTIALLLYPVVFWLYLYYIYSYFKKHDYFWREKSSNTYIIYNVKIDTKK